MRVIIGSENPAKVSAVQNVFQEFGDVEFVQLNVPSGVSPQPFSDEETIEGAINRATQAFEQGDIGIGLEGGVQMTKYGLFLCNWGALAEQGQPPLVAGGARLLLPDEVAGKLLAGKELGPVMDEYTKKRNIRKNEGAVGIFSNGQVDRAAMFTHIVKLLYGQYSYRKGSYKTS
ncbi:inosine/xanthosine triphosphatase [Bacillus sp. FJAT-27225]|uniref:DUF84 family protein n=1 Tax=Bacillus sp. FJAT-27225 TaxID=1743144 RepID=UPI00080C2EED|nr:DUF84 family protein [Bacillus sp. FJAT-27225]OCA91417.1 inosine/xanthosine triphosphatase [Bacillus sp. FJAT-27225]